jgi:hypothetical protein
MVLVKALTARCAVYRWSFCAGGVQCLVMFGVWGMLALHCQTWL